MYRFIGRIKHNKILSALVVLFSAILVIVSFNNDKYISASVADGLDISDSEQATVLGPFSEQIPDADIAFAYGLYIDGNFIAASLNEADIWSAVDTFVSRRAEALSIDASAEISVANDIKAVSGEYRTTDVVDSETLLKLLGIQNKYSATFELFDVYGNKSDSDIKLLAYVKTEAEEAVEYSIRNIYTDSLRSGKSSIVSKGSDGLVKNFYSCTYLDGELIEKELESSEVIELAVDEVYMVGTSTAMVTASFDGFMTLPYVNGRISSPFGIRSMGNHYGIDIIALSGSCYGDDIYAAADGVVTYVDSAGYTGYGKRVEITHADGIVTLYAHMSKVTVHEGDVVSAGELIGYVGTTGRVTGPHLHFEVYVDGVCVDPELFVTYPHV